jgi:hypothetical protein
VKPTLVSKQLVKLAIEFTIFTQYAPSIAPPKGGSFSAFLSIAPMEYGLYLVEKSLGLVGRNFGHSSHCVVVMCHILQALNAFWKFDAAVVRTPGLM